MTRNLTTTLTDYLKPVKKIYLKFSLLAIGISFPLYSIGQSADTLNEYLIDTFDLKEMVISSTKWKEEYNSQSLKINTISQRDINLQNPQTAADLLAVSKEVFIQKSQQAGGSPIIRGFSTNRLLYTMDGIRLNNAIYRGGNLHNVLVLDPFSIERTEVLFGPGSINYGSDAIGGVFSFSSLEHQKTDSLLLISGNSLARFSSANQEQSYHFDFNLRKGKWSWINSISKTSYQHLKMGSKGPNEYLNQYKVIQNNGVDSVIQNNNPLLQNPSAFEQKNVLQKILYTANPNFNIGLDIHYSESSPFARYDRFQSTTGDLPIYAKWNYGTQKWIMTRLGINHSKQHVLYDEMQLNIAYQNFEESRITRKLNNIFENNQIENVAAYSLNIDFKKDLNKNKSHRFYYGAEVIHNDVHSNGYAQDITNNIAINTANNNMVSIAPRYPSSVWNSYGTYFKHSFFSAKNISTHLGIRYNWNESTSDFSEQIKFYPVPFNSLKINNQSIVGSMGLRKNFSRKTNLTFNLSNAFRAPNIDDIGKIFDFQEEQIVVPNSELKPEQVYTADLNFKTQFKKIKVSTSIFYSYLNNAMVRRKFNLNGQDSILYNGVLSEVYAIQNAAYSSIYGVSTAIHWFINSYFNLSSTVNYQKGIEELDNGTISNSRHVAPLFMYNNLSFRHQSFTAEFYHHYNAKISNKNLNEEEKQKPGNYAINDSGNPYLPAFHTFNLKCFYLVNSDMSIAVGVENIFDIRYRTYSSGINAPGRNYIVSLKIRF